MNDLITARLRTVVPAAWGFLVAWLLTNIPALPDAIVEWLNGAAVEGVITTAVILGWYWLWNKYSSKVPNWLITLVLGSVKTPSYTPAAPVGIASVTPMKIARKAGVNITLTNGIEEHHPAT